MKSSPFYIFTLYIGFFNFLIAQEPVPGTALNFDGIITYIECGEDRSMGISNEMTIEAWIKVPSSFSPDLRVGTIFGNKDNTPYFNLEGHTNGRLRFIWNGGEVDVYAADFDMRDDRWHHIAVTRDSNTNQLIFYTDGHINGIFPAGSNADYHWPLRIGRDFTSNPAFPFNGILEEVRLWNVARSMQEIRENMHLTLTGNETGLLAYWQFNEAAGDITYDPVGAHNGTLHNFTEDDWIVSTVPVAGGTSISQIVNSTGVYDLEETGLLMNFTEKAEADTFVISRLNQQPNMTPAEYTTFNKQYWLINQFGSGTFSTDFIFIPEENITPEDESSPDALQLFDRVNNSDGSWSSMMAASAANSSNNTVTFKGISTLSQFIIGKQWFTPINPGIKYTYYGSVAWGDYDNDGDLDIVVSGVDSLLTTVFTEIYRNDSGEFTAISAGLTGAAYASIAWGDYDNDSDLDILLTGMDLSSNTLAIIYRNDNGIFTDINAGLNGIFRGSAAWGDYDNDGDLDILCSGMIDISFNTSTSLFRNDNGVFNEINSGLSEFGGSAAWGDYDNDGDLDILLNCINIEGPNVITRIYRNNAGIFTEIDAGLTGLIFGSTTWGDYDNDGDLDILLTGQSISSTYNSIIYRNDAGIFTDINAGLTGIYDGSASWGDYDNDGDPDILLHGVSDNGSISKIFRNDAEIFTDINAGLIEIANGSLTWGDYNNNGSLDILLTGQDIHGNIISRLYHNNGLTINSPPFPPSGLSSVISDSSITFTWNKANDNETPQDGLSYNLMLRTSESDTLPIVPMANLDNGTRLIPAIGNACMVTSRNYQIQIPEIYFYTQVITPYYWGVQAIDHAYAASPFATEHLIPIAYLQVYNDRIISVSDSLAWDIIHGDSVNNYQIQIDDDSSFSGCEIDETVAFLQDTTSRDSIYSVMLGDLTGRNNLVEGIQYYWRIKPNYTFGLPTAFTKPASSFWFGYVNAIEDNQGNAIPKEFSLQQNYPNPFNPVTQIKYALPKSCHVKIELFDIIGRKIKVLQNDRKPAGYYTFEFNAGHLASGIYIYHIQAENFVRSKKMLLIK